MNFILGANYWASHAGTEMWKNWDEAIVRKDLKVLAENGVQTLRVFPIWRDFQPIVGMYTSSAPGGFVEYRMKEDLPLENEYGLDEIMLERFQTFCCIAAENNINLIVGLVTGFMSGRLFVPPALNGMSIISDPRALMWQQKFIKGFVSRFKNEEAIYAWDLGNECNNLGEATNRESAYHWSAVIRNAIKAADNSRMVISGMHGLKLHETDIWRIQDQGEITDMLTTHPYPIFVPLCNVDSVLSMRTLLHATSETEMYRSIGGKPCLVEELGTLGPMVCNDESAAMFMRINLWSNWANGAPGVMWWCAHDQSELISAPYDWHMCERELGMLTKSHEPKPMLLEMKKFGEWLAQNPIELPAAETDAVCILTKGQDTWGVAYASYILSKQAGLRITYAYCSDELPDARIYLLPSINGFSVMDKHRYDALKEKVKAGATLYISQDSGFLTEFEELTGLSIILSEDTDGKSDTMAQLQLVFKKNRHYQLSAKKAKILDSDSEGNIVWSMNEYGSGKVYYLNFPLEQMLINIPKAFEGSHYKIYSQFAQMLLSNKPVTANKPYIGVTIHPVDNINFYAVAINYSANTVENYLNVAEGVTLDKVVYGSEGKLNGFEAALYKGHV